MTRWNRTEVEALISLYESHPFLYDTRHEDYHNRAKRDKILTELAERINEIRGNKLVLLDIKSKIKTLRTQYGAEKQHLAERLRHSNVSGKDGPYIKEEPLQESFEPKLWCYESLKFLDEFTKERADSSTTSNGLDEQKNKRVVVRPTPSKSCTVTETQTKPAHPTQRPIPPEKEDVFANFVSHELKQITDSKIQHETKWKIQLALKEGVEKQMELNAEGYITEVFVE
ncbi:uncharacterized protein LOC135838878 [Planococcus citri]|uniref:uncharacterized protein LOC135838878 n=1 Tax=Planococcus citri TaxID=170843 RepID=UPI0031F7B6CF